MKIFPKAIKVSNEYKCWPIWLYDINESASFEDCLSDTDMLNLPNIKTEWLQIS
jgi:hypothetical protein